MLLLVLCTLCSHCLALLTLLNIFYLKIWCDGRQNRHYENIEIFREKNKLDISHGNMEIKQSV